VPGEQAGSGAECVLFGAQDATACGATYELSMGAKTLTNITACDATAVQAILAGVLSLEGAGTPANVGTGSTATKIQNTAAVGKAVHSDLSVLTEEDCLLACSTYIAGCTHVTAGVFSIGSLAQGLHAHMCQESSAEVMSCFCLSFRHCCQRVHKAVLVQWRHKARW
jgi:hypothetical protein